MPHTHRTTADRRLAGLSNETFHPAGTLVRRYAGHDYGVASDDTAVTGVAHVSVTTDPEGGTPFFTIPADHLEPIHG